MEQWSSAAAFVVIMAIAMPLTAAIKRVNLETSTSTGLTARTD